MKLLEDKILTCGRVLPGNILKVDGFLNHQIDVALSDELGKEFFRLFAADNINKILTIESSGIAIACAAARYFNVPVVFAKKGHHDNVGDDCYSAEIFSFTKKKTYTAFVSKGYLSAGDNVLIIDDFLADGQAVRGLMKIVSDSGASLAGVGIAIEKGFQGGGNEIRGKGVKLKSLAIVESMKDGHIRFGNDG